MCIIFTIFRNLNTLRNRTKFAIPTPPPPPPDMYPFLSHRVSLESFMGRTGIFITFQIMIIVVDYFYDFCSDKIMKIDILTLLCSMENIQNLGTYLETIFKNVFLKVLHLYNTYHILYICFVIRGLKEPDRLLLKLNLMLLDNFRQSNKDYWTTDVQTCC